jgi:CheY-like chemotaxis protein
VQADGAPSARGTRRPGASKAAIPLRILVVDDNVDAAVSLAMLLRRAGHEIHIAHDGLEAVSQASAHRPDVVVLDIGLPKLNGYDAARRIKAQDGGDNVVLIALTGWGQKEDLRRSKEAQFDHHLTKPVEFAVLVDLLGRVARRRQAGRAEN